MKPATIRRKLSALSSLFTHLVDRRAEDTNPVREIRRPKINRKHGTTASFSPKETRTTLDAPDPEAILGLRDRTILTVGFQVGCKREESTASRILEYVEAERPLPFPSPELSDLDQVRSNPQPRVPPRLTYYPFWHSIARGWWPGEWLDKNLPL